MPSSDCFSCLESITYVINESILLVKNPKFLNQFKVTYKAKTIGRLWYDLKDLANPDNPLRKLVALDKQYNYENVFLRELIEVACEGIKVEDDEILRDAFYRPNSSTFTYVLLFHSSFKTLPLRQYVVDKLLAQCVLWEIGGMRADELWTWERYTDAESAAADKIWSYIGEVSTNKFEMTKLINTENDKMQEKLKITEMIPSCLDIYCVDATDKPHYEQLLNVIANSFANQIVRAVAIPEEIEQLVPIAKRLDPYSKSNVWNLFRVQDLPVADEENPPDLTTCYGLLRRAEKIFDLFIVRLKNICTEWKTLPISNWIPLFPDVRYLEHDLRILEPLLDAAVIPFLKEILEFWKGREDIICICQGLVQLLTHLEIPIPDDTRLFFEKIEQLNDTISGEDLHKVCQIFSANFSNKHSAQVLNLLARYKTSDDLIAFLHKLATTDVDNLLEAVNDWDETLISTKTVLDLVLIKTFLDRVYAMIKKPPAQREIHQVITCFENVQKDNEFKNIIQCFDSCSKSLSSIKRVYLELTNKEQSKRGRIFDIVQNATFHFIRQPVNTRGRIEHRFDVLIEEQSMYYADLGELCDRARLIEYSTNNSNVVKRDTEAEIRDLRSFVGMVAVIEKVLTNLTSLNMAGHPSISDYIQPETKFTCIAGNYQKLIEFSSSLETLLDDWEKNLCGMYEQNIDLTYFSNQQIWTVEDYLYNKASASTAHSGYHLLKCIGIEPDLIEAHFLPEKSEQAEERLKNLARILTAQRARAPFDYPMNNVSLNKILLVETSYDGILRAILSLFKMSETPPQVHHLFYCSDTTTWTEMRAFAYRCFYSQGTIHQLIRPELLTTLVQDQFTRFLLKLIRRQPRRLFRLGIITTASTAHLQLANGLKALQIVGTVLDQDLLEKADLQNMIKELVKGSSTLVTSHIAGLGKSTFIRDDIQRLGKRYNKFSVNGNINVDTLAERLRDNGEQLAFANAALHIDIGAVDNIQQLNELLYCLLLFRSFRLGQEAAHIPVDIPIYIEHDSSPHSLAAYEKIIVLQFLPCHHIEMMNLQQLKVNDKMSLQLVANYLQAIDNQTIVKRDIARADVAQLNADTCIALLQKHFLEKKNKEFITWTQLSIFLSVYESLFDGFSLCGHFIVPMMNEVNNPQLRLNILETLLQSADQFTSLSVESVRTNQRSTEGGPTTFSDAILRWDKAQPFTVVFSDSHDPIFVYKSVDHVSQSLHKEFELYNKVLKEIGLPEQNLLPDYSKLTHEEFFLKLATLSKKFYSKSICPKCFTQFENKTNQCTNCPTNDVLCNPQKARSEQVDAIIQRLAEKIKSEYVLTSDNYIKMLLIYLRVQSNLPVLIMGETGKRYMYFSSFVLI